METYKKGVTSMLVSFKNIFPLANRKCLQEKIFVRTPRNQQMKRTCLLFKEQSKQIDKAKHDM